MTYHEVFGDPVIIPGPNLRSLFTDTETVDDDIAESVDRTGTHRCPTCHRAPPPSSLICPDDGTIVMELPVVSRDVLLRQRPPTDCPDRA